MRLYHLKYKARSGEWTESATWWVQFSLNGKLVRKSLKTKDKRVAEMRALKLVEKEERRALGLADPFEDERERPLKDHIGEFGAFLGDRGVSEAHLEDRKLCLRQFLEMTKARTLPQIDLVEAQRWLGDLSERLSARSVNKRFQSLRQFGRWLVRVRRLGYNPFEGLSPRNEETDRRRVRRAFTVDELRDFIDLARARPLKRARINSRNKGVSADREAKLRLLGESRALLYEFAAGTGLRKGELRGLTWADVDEERRVLTVRATLAKSKTMQELPLRQDLAEGLVAHRERLAVGEHGTESQDAVFPGRLFPTHGTVRSDLVAAKLDGDDDQGRILDFHSLRVTFITRLSAAGVHPRTAQALARHSKLELTMKTYTDVRLLDLRGAVESARAAGQGGAGADKREVVRGGPQRVVDRSGWGSGAAQPLEFT